MKSTIAELNELNLNLNKAEIIYLHGWLLVFPKASNSSMLFLEWVENKISIVHSTISASNILGIRLNGTKSKAYEEACNYINNNL